MCMGRYYLSMLDLAMKPTAGACERAIGGVCGGREGGSSTLLAS